MYSFKDIQTKTRLLVGFTQSKIVQDYQTLGVILNQAFGNSKPSATIPKTVNELQQAMNAVFK